MCTVGSIIVIAANRKLYYCYSTNSILYYIVLLYILALMHSYSKVLMSHHSKLYNTQHIINVHNIYVNGGAATVILVW